MFEIKEWSWCRSWQCYVGVNASEFPSYCAKEFWALIQCKCVRWYATVVLLAIYFWRLSNRCHLQLLQNNLLDLLENIPFQTRLHMRFQHNRVPTYFSRAVKTYHYHRFPGWWRGLSGPQHWPLRSPELSPLNFCLWGHIKYLVYKKKVETRGAVLHRILGAVVDIKTMLKVMRAAPSIHRRTRMRFEAEGGHFELYIQQCKLYVNSFFVISLTFWYW